MLSKMANTLKKIIFTMAAILFLASCQIGPEFNTWNNVPLQRASEIAGIELYMVKETDWSACSSISNLEDMRYFIYECLWHKKPDEWVIYRRKGSGYASYRFMNSDYKRWDFETVEEVAEKMDVALSVIQNITWNDCDFILNLKDGYTFKVYEHKKSAEWIIFKNEQDAYHWYRIAKNG